ncbi:MAG TPA: ParA family protein [Allosphingosinicella sp.]|jgi:chromosome partitioning protein
MTAILACVNLKGGVGKTTLAVNFAAYCGLKGHKTLLIDLDPQTNATLSCISYEEWQAHSRKNGTVANLLGVRNHTSAEGDRKGPGDVIYPDVFKNVDLIPSHLDLFTVDLDLGAANARETLLKRALKPVLDDYDVVVCDCPPNLTIPTQNAIALSSHYVIPVSPDFLSSIGVGLLKNRIAVLAEALEVDIEPAGIVISRVGRTSYYRERTIQTLREEFDDVYDAVLTERSKVSEGTETQVSVFECGDRTAIQEFTAVSRKLLERIGVE